MRAADVLLTGTLAMAAVADHMGNQAGSIAYFAEHEADLCVLGELTDNEVCLGHRGRYYFDVTTARPFRPHLPQARGGQRQRARRAGGARARRLAATSRSSTPRCCASSAPETFVVPGPDLRRSAARRPLDDPRRVRHPRRLPAAARRRHRRGARRDRPLPRRSAEARAALPRRGRARRREGRLPAPAGLRGRHADGRRGPPRARASSRRSSPRTGSATRRASVPRSRR